MRWYWVIKCGGFVGCRKFDTEEAAKLAADKLTRISGRTWTVGKIFY